MLQRAAADGLTAYRDDRSYELTPAALVTQTRWSIVSRGST
jgi:hypothetical protein